MIRRGYRTSDNLFVLQTIIDKYVNKDKGDIYVCYVDFKSAYCKVSRNGMLLKLLQYGVGTKFTIL